MPVVKYLLAACLVAAGLFALTKQDDLRAAYQWSPKVEKAPIPSFDPKAVADASRIPVPENGMIVTKGPDTRSVAIPKVTGTVPSVKVALTGGSATLNGVVVGPSGEPLANATVRLERFEGEASTALDLRTDRQGGFQLPQALGGRYRVRAWRAPSYMQDGSEVTFVSDGEQRSFRLQVGAPSGDEMRVLFDSSPVIVGQTSGISVTVRGPYVNGNGQVEQGGKAGVEVSILGGGVLTGLAGTKPTDGGGLANFTIACNQIGEASFTLTSSAATRSFSVSCIAVPTTTIPLTTVPTGPSSAVTVPGSPTTVVATTATTRGA